MSDNARKVIRFGALFVAMLGVYAVAILTTPESKMHGVHIMMFFTMITGFISLGVSEAD